MKILYIPLDTASPDTDDLYKAFKEYGETKFYWLPHLNVWHPDLIYIHSGSLTVSLLKLLKLCHPEAKIVQWTGDYRPEGLDYFRKYAQYCDISFKADTDYIYDFETRYLPHGIADWQFREINPMAKGIIFIGRNYSQFPGAKQRFELCTELSKKELTWYGSPNPEISFYSIPDEYNRHQFGIAQNIYDAPGWIGNRPLMIMAAGCQCIIKKFPGIEDCFTDGYNCNIYDDMPEFEYDLNIVERGQRLARNYTYDKIVKNIIDQL